MRPWNIVSIGAGNGLSPNRRQAITRTNADLVSIWHSWISFESKWKQNIKIFIEQNAFVNVVFKMSAVLFRPSSVNLFFFIKSLSETTFWDRYVGSEAYLKSEHMDVFVRRAIESMVKWLTGKWWRSYGTTRSTMACGCAPVSPQGGAWQFLPQDVAFSRCCQAPPCGETDILREKLGVPGGTSRSDHGVAWHSAQTAGKYLWSKKPHFRWTCCNDVGHGNAFHITGPL